LNQHLILLYWVDASRQWRNLELLRSLEHHLLLTLDKTLLLLLFRRLLKNRLVRVEIETKEELWTILDLKLLLSL